MNPDQSIREYHTVFVTHHLYYIPQFLPVAKELIKRGKSILFLLLNLDAPRQNNTAVDFFNANNLPYKIYNENAPSLTCKFMINGANTFPDLNINYKYSALIVHGIGTKSGYYSEEQNKHDIRFVEGEYRINKIKELFPGTKSRLYNVGFAKLDEAFNMTARDKIKLMEKYELNPGKKTILYAPTFYPSSISNMPATFPDEFKDYNIIVKPHFFSFSKKKYHKHVHKFNKWGKYNNVFIAGIEDFNLVPFMSVADIMVSDESSAIFEFAALNKPVIINRDVKFRLSYRIFRSKIRKRMDSVMTVFKEAAVSVHSFKELRPVIEKELKHPEKKEAKRRPTNMLLLPR